MRCKAASAPQCEHCKQESTPQRAGYGSKKHIYLLTSTLDRAGSETGAVMEIVRHGPFSSSNPWPDADLLLRLK
jgi:hypothetical protein